MSTVDALTDAERDTLSQLQAITNGADVDTQISLLQSVDWDLPAALQAIYGDERPPRVREDDYEPATTTTMETLEVDDSLVFGAQPRTRNYPFSRFVGGTPGRIGLFSILMAPFSVTVNLLSSLFHFIFRVLRIPFPRLNTLALSFNVNNRSARRGSVSDDPGVVAERWVRELEEETGAVCISKAALMDANGHGDNDDGDNEPGPSSRVIKRRGGGGGSKMKTLPDFFLGGYDAALRLAQREARVLCVILTSEEHDDVPAFRRDVLADAEFVRTLTDNHIIIWGGDVRERDAYQASMKLGATTYPFVAFIALYARTSGPDTMTVITRHSGPSTSITSSETLVGHITNTVLPRVAPVLNRRRAEQQSRDYERRLREEQDRAYADSQRKDFERIVKRRQEEERQREAEEQLKIEAQIREEQAKRAAAERTKKIGERMAWRRYARRMLVPQETPGSKTAVRIGIRMPSGKLIVRKFEPTDTVTGLYAFVASQFIPASDSPEDDPLEPPSGTGEFGAELERRDWDWEFRLAVAFPKSVVEWKIGERTVIGDVPALKGGANVVVEMQRPIETGVKDGDETASEDSESE